MSLFILDTVGDVDLLKADHALTVPIVTQRFDRCKSILLSQKSQEENNFDCVENKNEIDEQARSFTLDREVYTYQSYGNQIIETAKADGNFNNPELGLFNLPTMPIDICEIISHVLITTKQRPTPLELELDRCRHRLKMAMVKRYEKMPKRILKTYIDIDHGDDGAECDEKKNDKPMKDLELMATDINAVFAKSDKIINLEHRKYLPKPSKRAQITLNRIEREKTKGNGWFNMSSPEITEEIENDLKILKMRTALDPKRFYKKNDLKVLPKYFQIGVVQHSPLDYYNERNQRRNKKHSLVDEILADSEAQTYTKRKYNEIIVKRDKYNYRRNMKK